MALRLIREKRASQMTVKTQMCLQEIQKSFSIGHDLFWSDLDRAYKTIKNTIEVHNENCDKFRGKEKNKPQKLMCGCGDNHIWIHEQHVHGITKRLMMIVDTSGY